MTIESISSAINSLINKARAPIATIPAILLIFSAIKRPGLSPIVTAANIIRRQAEAGAPFGPAADGSANIAEAMERIRVEEIFKALKMDSRVQVGFPLGAIRIMGMGSNGGGPMTITGFNVNIPHGDGIIG